MSKPKRRQASTPVAIDSQRCPTTGAALGYLHVDRHCDQPARRYRFQKENRFGTCIASIFFLNN
ncbi:hypothetical protein APV28_4733 [Comamonas testosteroni]|nr:hypothetical protein APV28_4733 [Comamonas testosteroni]